MTDFGVLNSYIYILAEFVKNENIQYIMMAMIDNLQSTENTENSD